MNALSRLLPGAPFMRYSLVVLVALYLAFGLGLRGSDALVDVWSTLALDPSQVFARPAPWQLVTYALLHDLSDPMHLVFNGMTFYFFGRDLEERWGTKRIAGFTLATVIAGALLVVLVYAVGLGGARVVGASAAGTAFVIAWGLTFREREMILFVFRTRGITLVWITLALETLNAVSLSGVSSAAHWGGIGAGALLWALWEPSPLRRIFLRSRLAKMEAEAARYGRGPKRTVPGHLRVIPGGKDEPPKDKRFLN